MPGLSVSGGVDPQLRPFYDYLGIFQPQVGKYYHGARLTGYYAVVTNQPANRLRANYYPIFRKMRFDRIAILIQGVGGAGSKIRLGIYEDDDFMPGALLLDAGEVSAESVSVEAYLPINITLDKGIYWLACVTNDETIDLGYHYEFLSICGMTGNLEGMIGAYVKSFTYGPLPDTFGAASESNFMILLELRVAEVF